MTSNAGSGASKNFWISTLLLVGAAVIALTFQWPRPFTVEFEIQGEGYSIAEGDQFGVGCHAEFTVPFLNSELTMNYFFPKDFNVLPLSHPPQPQVEFDMRRRRARVTMQDPMFSWGKYRCSLLTEIRVEGDPACSRVWELFVRRDLDVAAPTGDIVKKYALLPRTRRRAPPCEESTAKSGQDGEIALPRTAGQYRVVLDMTDLPPPVPEPQPPRGPMYGPEFPPGCNSTPDGLRCSTE